MTKWILPSTVLAVALFLVLPIAHFAREQTGLLIWFDREDDAQLVLGQNVYDANCAACHGANLEGQPDWRSPGPDGLMPAPPHDETGHTWHHADDLLFAITKYGVAQASGLDDYESAMPAYEGLLSDQEIVAVLAYIKSTWPEDIQARHDTLNARFQR